jgi:hypothetical protein
VSDACGTQGPENRPPEWVPLTATSAEVAVSGRWLETMDHLLPGAAALADRRCRWQPQVGLPARLFETAPRAVEHKNSLLIARPYPPIARTNSSGCVSCG